MTSEVKDDQALKPGCKMHFQSVYASDMDCKICGRGEGEVCPEYAATIPPPAGMDCDLCKGSGLTNQGHNCSRCGGSGVRLRARRAHIMSDAIDPYAVTEVMVELVGDQVVLVLTANDEGLSAILDIHYATLLRDKLDVAIRAMLAKVKP